MFAWSFAMLLGVTGALLGKFVSSGAGKSNESLYMLGFSLIAAILGAVLGGSMDIVHIIRVRTTKPK